MAKIKYEPGQNPIIGEHGGFVFQGGRYYPVITSSKKNDRHRRPVQWQRQTIMFKLVKLWRDLSSTYKTAWENFATTYPQPTHRYSTVYLSGQQLFLKRNFYQLLNFGIDSDPILEPIMDSFVQDDCTPTLKLENDRLILYLEFSNYTEDLIYQFFCSRQTSSGKTYPINFSRYMGFAQNIISIIPTYGFLYNQFAYRNASPMCPPGWHVPTLSELEDLRDYVGYNGGFKLKETGFTYWDFPNTGATNSEGLFLRGASTRVPAGAYGILNRFGQITAYDLSFGRPQGFQAEYNNVFFVFFNTDDIRWGMPIRWLKDDSNFVSEVTGNNGIVYPCVNINGQIWTIYNVLETKFRDGSDINFVPDDATWSTTTDNAFCMYNNDPDKAFTFGNNTIDITELYVQRFGLLPHVGDNVLLQILPMSLNSGKIFDKQYFELTIE